MMRFSFCLYAFIMMIVSITVIMHLQYFSTEITWLNFKKRSKFTSVACLGVLVAEQEVGVGRREEGSRKGWGWWC